MSGKPAPCADGTYKRKVKSDDKRDAERWRFVKSQWKAGYTTVWYTQHGWATPALSIACSSPDLDAAIDAAIAVAAQKEPPPCQ